MQGHKMFHNKCISDTNILSQSSTVILNWIYIGLNVSQSGFLSTDNHRNKCSKEIHNMNDGGYKKNNHSPFVVTKCLNQILPLHKKKSICYRNLKTNK